MNQSWFELRQRGALDVNEHLTWMSTKTLSRILTGLFWQEPGRLHYATQQHILESVRFLLFRLCCPSIPFFTIVRNIIHLVRD